MSLSPAAFGHLVFAVAILLVAARLGAFLFAKLHQPRVIGEIVGGLVLGPTMLGAISPASHAMLWQTNTATANVLGALAQVGLALLMFCSGFELRSQFARAERRTAIAMTVAGIVVPFAAVWWISRSVDVAPHLGAAKNVRAFILVAAIAVAVTSIPVISRILVDLGIIHTPFAGIILSAAVIEDTLLWVVLQLAVMVGKRSEDFGVSALAYHVSVTFAFLLASAAAGSLLRRALKGRVVTASHAAIVLFSWCLFAIALDIAPFLGAFAAGIALRRAIDEETKTSALETIKSFSFAFPVPIYFALVGLRLDLLRHFAPLFFLAFLAFACVIKMISVYAGARMAGESNWASLNLAVAMNARGGPGIVLATVSFDAAIINEHFYVVLVMLALVTSSIAGAWLGFVQRRGWSLR